VTSKGIIAAYYVAEKYLVIDRAAWSGTSGSPVYVPSGRVIGMLVRTATGAGEGLSMARPIDLIRPFLSRFKIPLDDVK
jgi:S1-C subfamily serine protease